MLERFGISNSSKLSNIILFLSPLVREMFLIGYENRMRKELPFIKVNFHGILFVQLSTFAVF